MTNIRLVYDPFEKKARIYNEQEEITAIENKIGNFLEMNGFYSCLLPFRGRYAIWDGLLPELVSEVNDDELHIVFEGRRSDYRRVQEAFRQSVPAVSKAGYENKWELACQENFETGHIRERMESVADALKEICESRKELGELDDFIRQVKDGSVEALFLQLQDIVVKHREKWEYSSSQYRYEKISYLELVQDGLGKLKIRLRDV